MRADGRGCASGSPGGPTGTRAGSRRPHQAHVHRVEHRGQALHSPGHRLPRRQRRAPLPRGRRQALDADATRGVLRRGGPRAFVLRSRRPVRAGHQRPVERPAGIRGRPGQIAIHGTATSRARSGPRSRTAASGSAPGHHLAGEAHRQRGSADHHAVTEPQRTTAWISIGRLRCCWRCVCVWPGRAAVGGDGLPRRPAPRSGMPWR